MSIANRVVKNTGFLYIKMGITVFVSLYTTRLILASLGASDFGIFNIVGGAIGMLGFLNSTLANATQRFMSYAEGEGDLCNKRKIFNISICLHLFIAIITAFLLICVMPTFFNRILNIESDRILSAKIIYISFIFSTLITIINVPYDAVMNAHENMLYYSVVGILDSLLRLGVAFACVYSSGDKLIVYGVLMALIPLLTLSIMKVYCHRKYSECVIQPRKYWDATIVKQIAMFSGWNFLTAVSSLFSAQGIGLVLNHFWGTRLNAAQGVAHQLNGQLSSFSITMLKALNPIIVKNAGARDIISMNNITIAGCKFSSLLIAFFAIPFILEMPFILQIWLKEIPKWTIAFCEFQLIHTLVCQIANPIATAVYAQGDIKEYAIWKSVMNIAPVIVTYVCFLNGASPVWLYVPMIIIWGIGGDIVIIHYARIKCKLPVMTYFKSGVLPVFIICFIMFLIGFIPHLILDESFSRLIVCSLLTSISLLISSWICGLNNSERLIVYGVIDKFKKEKRVFRVVDFIFQSRKRH